MTDALISTGRLRGHKTKWHLHDSSAGDRQHRQRQAWEGRSDDYDRV